MRKDFEKEIGGIKWRVKQYPATEGINLLGRISKVVSGPVSKGLSAIMGGGLSLETDVSMTQLADALRQALDRLGEPDVAELAKALCSCLSYVADGGEVKDAKAEFDELFAGEFELLGRVLAWVLEVNFNQVFRSLRSGVVFLGSRSAAGAQASGPLAP